jgi:hypothetical protein
MATVHVTMGRAGAQSETSMLPVYQRAARSETITSSGSSAQGSLKSGQGEVVSIFCETAVYVTLGANPAATATNGRFVPGGQLIDIKCGANDIVAVIDA